MVRRFYFWNNSLSQPRDIAIDQLCYAHYGYYNLCGIEIKIVAMLCFISWLSFAEYVPILGFQSPLLTNKAT
jgi:hypothetical protein